MEPVAATEELRRLAPWPFRSFPPLRGSYWTFLRATCSSPRPRPPAHWPRKPGFDSPSTPAEQPRRSGAHPRSRLTVISLRARFVERMTCHARRIAENCAIHNQSVDRQKSGILVGNHERQSSPNWPTISAAWEKTGNSGFLGVPVNTVNSISVCPLLAFSGHYIPSGNVRFRG